MRPIYIIFINRSRSLANPKVLKHEIIGNKTLAPKGHPYNRSKYRFRQTTLPPPIQDRLFA